MNRLFVALAVVAGAVSTAVAQPPGAELSISAFLERRVPEELASEGHVLSRNNLALKVETAGDIAVISLVDLNTGRVAASTKIDQLPADREAAVASVTHIAADLLTQISGREAPPPPPAPPVVDDRAERAAHEVAELKFNRQAIRFGTTYDLYVSNTTAVLARNWVPYRGELNQEIEPQEFYKLVGHPELGESYDSRRKGGIAAAVAGTGLMVGGLIYLSANTGINCDIGSSNFDMCLADHDRAFHQAAFVSTALVIVGGGAFVVGLYFYRHPHPISETEAKDMAAEYNNGIRRNLGLPVVERHWLHDIRIQPYALHGEGGLALGARF
jgi:hypothetical protein